MKIKRKNLGQPVIANKLFSQQQQGSYTIIRFLLLVAYEISTYIQNDVDIM